MLTPGNSPHPPPGLEAEFGSIVITVSLHRNLEKSSQSKLGPEAYRQILRSLMGYPISVHTTYIRTCGGAQETGRGVSRELSKPQFMHLVLAGKT